MDAYSHLMSIIQEASKRDADNLEGKGKEIRTLKKGSNIVRTLSDKRREEDFDDDDTSTTYIPKVKRANLDKISFDKSKELRKKNIKSSTRSANGSVPEYGADPRYSRDADRKQKEKYLKSLKNKDVDIDKSTKNIDDGLKKKIIQDRIKKGKDIPDKYKNDIVKKETETPKQEAAERHLRTYFRKQYNENEINIYKQIVDAYKVMKDATDYAVYKKAHDTIARLTGYPTDASFGSFRASGGKQIEFRIYNKPKPKEISDDTKLYHTSNQNNITRLTPTFKTSDGVYHATPRVYCCIGSPGSRMTGAGGGNDGSTTYLIMKKVYQVFEDPELHGNAVYIETNSDVPVKKVEHPVKESVNDIKLRIYQEYKNGTISDMETMILLERVTYKENKK